MFKRVLEWKRNEFGEIYLDRVVEVKESVIHKEKLTPEQIEQLKNQKRINMLHV